MCLRLQSVVAGGHINAQRVSMLLTKVVNSHLNNTCLNQQSS